MDLPLGFVRAFYTKTVLYPQGVTLNQRLKKHDHTRRDPHNNQCLSDVSATRQMCDSKMHVIPAISSIPLDNSLTICYGIITIQNFSVKSVRTCHTGRVSDRYSRSYL